MRSILLGLITLIATYFGGATSNSANDIDGRQGSKVCADFTSVGKLACRIHREAIWSIASLLAGIAKEHGMTGTTVLAKYPGAVEEGIVHSAAELRAAGIEVPDLQERYDLQAILSALEAVPVLLSSGSYAYSKGSDSQFTPPRNTERALDANIGLCGNMADLFSAVLTQLGLQTRTVQFWWRDQTGMQLNHIAIEVFWNGRWRLYDPTFGAYFVKTGNGAAGALDARSARKVPFSVIVNPNATTYRYYKLAGIEPFEYLTQPDVDLTIGGKGTIGIALDSENGVFTTEFIGVPNYLGDNHEDGTSEGLQFRFTGLAGQFDATINVAAVAGCQSSSPFLNDQSFSPTTGTHTFQHLKAPFTLEMRGSDDVCYIVLRSIRFDRVAEH